MAAVAALVLALLCWTTRAGAQTPRVTGDASSLDRSTVAALDRRLGEIEADAGVEMRVLVRRRLGGLTTAEVAREQAGSPGEAGRITLVLGMAERRVRIEAEGPVASRLSDIDRARIIEREMLADLRASRHATAILQGVEGVARALDGQTPRPADARHGDWSALRDIWLVLVCGALVFLGFSLRRERTVLIRGRG